MEGEYAHGSDEVLPVGQGHDYDTQPQTTVMEDVVPEVSAAAEMPHLSFSSPSGPLSLGHSVGSTLTVSQVVAAGGVAISLSTSDPTTTTVYPGIVKISPATDHAEITYTNLKPGTVTISASATGYDSATTTVSSDVSPIPATLFGLSINKPTLMPPIPITFSTTRTWDVYPKITWKALNPAPGVFDFSALDAYIAWHTEHGGAQITYTLGDTPEWASSQPSAICHDGPGSCAPPVALDAWDEFVRAIAIHTNGKIRIWELWNEPQDSGYYNGDIDTMATLAQHAYSILKSIDPTSTVLSPAPTGGLGPRWLLAFFAAGGGESCDVVAFHGYWNSRAESLVTVVQNYRIVMRLSNQSTKPLWDTEADWNGGVVTPTTYSDRQAFLAKYYLLHWSLGVDRFIWYEYDGAVWGGLWNEDNGVLPEGNAFRIVEEWLVGADMSEACSEDQAGTWSCGLSRVGGYSAQVVWNSSITAAYRPAPRFVQVRNLAGETVPLTSEQIPVGTLPVLLETGVPPPHD